MNNNLNLKAPIYYTSVAKAKFSQFLNSDKRAGVKKAWYYHHIDANQMQAIDTRADFLDYLAFMDSQGISKYKTIAVSNPKSFSAKEIKLHVLRKEGSVLNQATIEDGSFVVDEVGLACGYLPASCELVVAEVIFVKPN